MHDQDVLADGIIIACENEFSTKCRFDNSQVTGNEDVVSSGNKVMRVWLVSDNR